MWKTVGSLNPNNNKQNRSKDQACCQPFGQASRLKLNQSQLSGQKSHRFMNEYLTNWRSAEGPLHRVMSQKTIQVREATSPPDSLKQIQSLKCLGKTQTRLEDFSLVSVSLHELSKSIEQDKPIVALRQKLKKIQKQLKSIRLQQIKINKSLRNQVEAFKQELRRIQGQLFQRIQKMQKNYTGQERINYPNVNPQLLSKIKQQGMRFNEKMKDLDARREQIKGRYKDKYQLNEASNKGNIISKL